LIALRGAQSFSAPPAPASFLLLKSEIKMSLIRSFINRTSLGARGGEFYGNPFRDSAGRDVDAFFFFVWTRHHRSFFFAWTRRWEEGATAYLLPISKHTFVIKIVSP
jgi:hypothetical protein